LIDYLEAGDSLDKFLDAFPSVTREQVVAALEIAREALMPVRILLDESLPRQLAISAGRLRELAEPVVVSRIHQCRNAATRSA